MKKPVLDTALKGRFEDALASGKLRELAEQMKADKLSQAAIYHRFDLFMTFLRDANRESDEGQIAGCLDCIWGFCTPSQRWFERGLTDEDLQAYLKTIS